MDIVCITSDAFHIFHATKYLDIVGGFVEKY